MAEIAEWTAQQTLKLPPEIANRFRSADRFIAWAEGDMLYLKRITPPPVTQIVEQAPEGDPCARLPCGGWLWDRRLGGARLGG